MSATDRRLRRLRVHVDALAAAALDPAADRVGAVLVLLAPRGDDLEFVLTRRREDLATHPGQVSFPGGRREPSESTEAAALREAAEEIGLRPDTVAVLGRLPAFFIPPSRFWMAPVVARWHRPHRLRPQESEVASIVRAPLSVLVDPARWRKVRLSVTGWSWAWQLDDGHILWGATGMVIAGLLDVVEPRWHGGASAADLDDDREVMPWLDPRLANRALPARLEGVGTRRRDDVAQPARADLTQRTAAGQAVARAVGHLRDAPRSVVVLVGPGGTGAVGLEAARALRHGGWSVLAVTAGHNADGAPSTVFTGTLPAADLYIDALVGSGLEGRLRGVPLDMMLALRTHGAPVLSIDLPSGLHPTNGLVGDAVSATVTIALDGVWPAVEHVGLSPFVGDLYLWRPGEQDVVRLVGGPERTVAAGWRE